jgi:hypothetical protein
MKSEDNKGVRTATRKEVRKQGEDKRDKKRKDFNSLRELISSVKNQANKTKRRKMERKGGNMG